MRWPRPPAHSTQHAGSSLAVFTRTLRPTPKAASPHVRVMPSTTHVRGGLPAARANTCRLHMSVPRTRVRARLYARCGIRRSTVETEVRAQNSACGY